jgi:hypothetical protein
MKEEYERQHPLDGDSGVFSFVTRDGKEFAVAKSGREYALWGAETSARLRRVQLRAFEEVELELIGRNGGPHATADSVSTTLENQDGLHPS